MKSRRTDYLVGEPITYRFRNGVPNRLTLLAVPHVQKADISRTGHLYADPVDARATDAAGRSPVRLFKTSSRRRRCHRRSSRPTAR